MTSNAERETTVVKGKTESVVRIWTLGVRRTDARKLDKDTRVTCVKRNSDDVGGFYEVPADQWSVTSGLKRRSKPMSEERRQEMAARLRSYREQNR